MFDVAGRYPGLELVALDQNARLIATYRVIRDAAPVLIAQLAAWQAAYWAADEPARTQMYYAVRHRFNAETGSAVDQAAAFIFLNRTCFNGLYRVNRQGQFNVLAGRYRLPRLSDGDNLLRAQRVFQRVTLLAGDFRDALRYVDAHTFVYCDPPYRPLTATASFTAYAAGAFGDDQQRDLAAFGRQCRDRGAAVMVSNSDPRNVNPDDDFFDALYHDFAVTRIPARRAINARPDRRGSIQELVITNYPVSVPQGVAPVAARPDACRAP